MTALVPCQALAWRDGAWSAAEVDRAAGDVARRLGELEPGARVAVVAPNCPALVAALLGVWGSGAAAVLVHARCREYELGRILRDAEPVAVVSVASAYGYDFAAAIARLAPEVPGLRTCLLLEPDGTVRDELRQDPSPSTAPALDDDVAALLYTSGTTGEPKGTLWRHAAARHGAHQLAVISGLAEGDAAALVPPGTHAFGLACLQASLETGGTLVLVDSTLSVEPLAEAIDRHRVGVLHGSPAMFAAALKAAPGALRRVRTGFVAGAPCPPELLERLEDAGPRILNLFGMTELGAACSCRLDDPPEIRHRTVGRPLAGYAFRASEDGELQVRGPHVTPGYYRRPDATAAAFQDGWFRTGDLGAISADGVVTISGRAKEVANVGGFNVFPAEVEGYLLTHPDVVAVGIVAVPDERMGEALRAYVVARPGSGLTPTDVRAHARKGIAGYKVPSAVELVGELPLLASGKVDRRALADA